MLDIINLTKNVLKQRQSLETKNLGHCLKKSGSDKSQETVESRHFNRFKVFKSYFEFSKESKNALTGVLSCGVANGLEMLDWKRMPDPKSKSQILIGQRRSSCTHKMFSGLRSLCAIPLACMNRKADAISLTISAAAASLKYLYSCILPKSCPPLIWKKWKISDGNST